LTLDTIHKSILNVEYAVRGELAIKADKYTQILKAKQQGEQGEQGGKDSGLGGMESRNGEKGEGKEKDGKEDLGEQLPFDKVVTANIGNPQQRGLDQKPITFWRQVSWRGGSRWVRCEEDKMGKS
jgi:alanine transaminase